MPDKAWKALERRIAESLGTVRTPLSGGSSRHTTSDTLHKELYIECKYRRSSSIHTLFHSVRIEANKEHKLSVIAIHLASSPHTLAVIDWNLFINLWEAYTCCQETTHE